MTVMTDETKLRKFNQGVGTLVAEYVAEDRPDLASKLMKLADLLPEQKIKLFDILSAKGQ